MPKPNPLKRVPAPPEFLEKNPIHWGHISYFVYGVKLFFSGTGVMLLPSFFERV